METRKLSGQGKTTEGGGSEEIPSEKGSVVEESAVKPSEKFSERQQSGGKSHGEGVEGKPLEGMSSGGEQKTTETGGSEEKPSGSDDLSREKSSSDTPSEQKGSEKESVEDSTVGQMKKVFEEPSENVSEKEQSGGKTSREEEQVGKEETPQEPKPSGVEQGTGKSEEKLSGSETLSGEKRSSETPSEQKGSEKGPEKLFDEGVEKQPEGQKAGGQSYPEGREEKPRLEQPEKEVREEEKPGTKQLPSREDQGRETGAAPPDLEEKGRVEEEQGKKGPFQREHGDILTIAEAKPPPELPDRKERNEEGEGKDSGNVGKDVGKETQPGEKIWVQQDVKCEIIKRSHGELDKNTTVPITQVDKPKSGHSYYEVIISTGEEAGASTFDRGVYFVLEGTKGATGKQYVRKLFSKAATKGATDVLQLEANSDLGDLLVATVGSDEPWVEMLKKPWFVEYIAVHNFQSRETMTFPCYHWITSGSWMSMVSRTTLEKDVTNNGVLTYHRKTVLEQRRKQYLWQEFPQTLLPSGLDTSVSQLPQDEEFDNVKNFNFVDAVNNSPVLSARISSRNQNLEHLRDFETLAEAEPHHHVRSPLYEVARWTRDDEFGEQMLNGVNPCLIRKCTSLPENFNVSSEMVQGSLTRGSSLEDEMKNGHVYICDLKILDEIPCRESFHCAAPLCLLYVNSYNKLVPIAIQLKQKPGDDNPVFLPSDRMIDWLLAKIHFQSAFAQMNLLAMHYLSCHFIVEAFIVATMRNLPDSHPVFNLLRPHMRTTLSVNWRSRETLLNDGGLLDQLMSIGGEGKNELLRRASSQFNLQMNNIAKDLKERGVDNEEQLPGYKYRDDGLKIWDALKSYVEGIISLYYGSDEDVKDDMELRSWSQDLVEHAFPKRGADCGIPGEIESREVLVEICTTVIFTATALHAAVTAPLFKLYSYVPNAPLSMSRIPPSVKGLADVKTLLASLPEEEAAAKTVALVSILSRYASNEAYSGHFPFLARFNYQWFTEPRAKELILNLRSKLDSVSMQIRERNRPLEEPYTALIPELIPSSITI